MSNSSNDLLSSFRRDNPEVVDYLFKHHYRSLVHFAVRLIHNKEAAETIAADTFAKLTLERTDLEDMQKLKLFLYTTTRNGCISYLRTQKQGDDPGMEYTQTKEEEHEWELEMIQAMVLQELHADIERLPNQCKEVFKSTFFDNMNSKQIAENMGITVNTVINFKLQAQKILRFTVLKKCLGAASPATNF